jgi:hypothetical protein
MSRLFLFVVRVDASAARLDRILRMPEGSLKRRERRNHLGPAQTPLL